ncbi:chromatin assembly factor 1 subunit A [Clupea harengus]|uniref:Chromatin assembly factor 1 subunit A n=1 Tax=Clupea harengus TaxID=7950 RepID=A0A6P8G587_CLUHA|nr:chromatin assembly factor 1 subunit A [Clupea harengus]
MLAAEDPSADGPLASTLERSMDCADKNNSAKKLVQARLPFKRLNPELKGNRETKRARGPPVSSCLGSGLSDGENDANDSSPPLCHRPPVVNGRGPLDGFVIKKKHPGCPPAVTIDLTEDSNSSDTVHQRKPRAVPEPSPPTDERIPGVLDASHPVNSQSSVPTVKEQSDGHMEKSDLQENTVMEESMQEDSEGELRHESGLLSSPASSSSLSTAESSPEANKSAQRTPSFIEEPDESSEMKKGKRNSLKIKEDERQHQRAERERQRLEAKAANEKKKLEARRLKEEKEKERKERKEKEEREKREKREKEEKEKAEKLKTKAEERKSKQEAKLEEKRKKEEEKRMKEEKDRLKAEKAEITRFLQKPKAQLAPKTLASACGKFAPFEIKEHMCLAPLCRVPCENAVLDQYLAKPDRSASWLKELTRRKPRCSGPTKPKPKHQDPGSDELVVVKGPKTNGAPDQQYRARMKLLQFHENYRPAYWGTWSKKSTCISARCPIQQDKELFDYEVDSDEEWEEDEPGESLSHSEGDDEDGDGEDDSDDDVFFVPHGYLSDGEGALGEEVGDLEKQKLRQKLKAREWDELLAKKKVKVLEAVITGCLWDGEREREKEFSPTQMDMLKAHAIAVLEPLPKDEPSSPANSPGQQRDELLPQLLPLLHGNINSSKVIISEFQEFCRQQATCVVSSPQGSGDSIPTRVGVKRLIKESAVYAKRSCFRRCCWYVHAEVLARFSLESLPVPCQWNYLTPGVQQCREDPQMPITSQGNSPTTPQPTPTLSSKRKSAGSMSIKKFMKKSVDQEQTAVMETDGFQADTEDEEEDCVYINTESGFLTQNGGSSSPQPGVLEPMEVSASTAFLLPCPTST